MLESLRKDVECTFGILKGRFRILKTAVRLHRAIDIDKVFLTCCILHNMLLKEDNLVHVWEHNVDYRGADGAFEVEDMPRVFSLANERRNLNSDLSTIGREFDTDTDDRNSRAIPNDIVPEYESSHGTLVNALLAHFKFQWSQRRVGWARA